MEILWLSMKLEGSFEVTVMVWGGCVCGRKRVFEVGI